MYILWLIYFLVLLFSLGRSGGDCITYTPDSNILYMCTPHDMYDSSCSSSMQDEGVSMAVVVAIFVKDTLGSKQVIADVAI